MRKVITVKLTDVMRNALEYLARIELGDHAAIGAPRTGTAVALIDRGLITAGSAHRLTDAGWVVAESLPFFASVQ